MVNGDVKDCVKWCDNEYISCANQVALRMPEDEEEYTPCHLNWESCENACHSD